MNARDWEGDVPLPRQRYCACEDHTGYEDWHGRIAGYTFHRCDCLECVTAIRAYHSTPARRRAQREANTFRSHARRARVMGVAHERYSARGIAERDRWTCGLCAGRIDARLKWPDTGSFSIDHIIPLRRGGSDTSGNVQAAHLGCNIRKNDRVQDLDNNVNTHRRA